MWYNDDMDDKIVPAVDFQIDWMSLGEGLDDFERDLLPFMAFGVPYVQVANLFGVTKSAISKRISRNKSFANAIAEARKTVKWELHRIMLNQKAVIAWHNMDYYLTVDPFEKDEKDKYIYDATMRRELVKEKARMTRFTLEQLGLRIQKVEVEHNVPKPMFVGDSSAAEIVVQAIKRMEIEEPKRAKEVVGEYKVLEGGTEAYKPDTKEIEEIESPWFKTGNKSNAT